jgi:hypothetical protein
MLSKTLTGGAGEFAVRARHLRVTTRVSDPSGFESVGRPGSIFALKQTMPFYAETMKYLTVRYVQINHQISRGNNIIKIHNPQLILFWYFLIQLLVQAQDP